MRTDNSLEFKVEFLRRPEHYPPPASPVDDVETHLSWVFLNDHHAYKLKKPLRFGRLDFRTLPQRLHFCREELRLNRRLAEDVYLDVVPLGWDAEGGLRLETGVAHAVDWLVKMRRLPAYKMLDHALVHGLASEDDIERVADRLLHFYRGSPGVAVSPAVYLNEFRRGIGCNERVLRRPQYDLPQDRVHDLCAMQRATLAYHADWIRERAAQGKVLEGHGDLRPEHVCLEDQVSIIDCLEFSRELRLIDPADEIAYLALEMECLGGARLAHALLDRFRAETDNWPEPDLLHFYQAYRALTRARIAILHLEDPRYRATPHWQRRALDYLASAERHQYAIRMPASR